MKIRLGFVSNSSSASFLITHDQNVDDICLQYYDLIDWTRLNDKIDSWTKGFCSPDESERIHKIINEYKEIRKLEDQISANYRRDNRIPLTYEEAREIKLKIAKLCMGDLINADGSFGYFTCMYNGIENLTPDFRTIMSILVYNHAKFEFTIDDSNGEYD